MVMQIPDSVKDLFTVGAGKNFYHLFFWGGGGWGGAGAEREAGIYFIETMKLINYIGTSGYID